MTINIKYFTAQYSRVCVYQNYAIKCLANKLIFHNHAIGQFIAMAPSEQHVARNTVYVIWHDYIDQACCYEGYKMFILI